MKVVRVFTILIILVSFVVTNARAEEQKPVAEVMVGAYGLSWSPNVSYAKLILTVATPNGTVFKKTFEAGAIPGFDLSSLEGGVFDGSYTYELRVIPVMSASDITNRDKPEFNRNFSQLKALTQSGTFSVRGGSIVNPNMSEQPMGTKDQVILDDLIVTSSACIGFDCVNGESFGFDTLRLKENNLRIKAQDTSTSGSFPSNDWQITFNDSSNGGANKFSIDDITGNRTPFTIEASAPTNSLFIEDSGQIGFGTSTPVVDLHTVSGNTPTLRLEQDGSSGFTPQTWDIAGNEANFFIRDATNGSELPFRILPGAASNLLYLSANDRVGINNSSPNWPLSVKSSGEDCAVVVERTDGTNHKGYFAAGSGYFFAGSITDHPLRFVTAGQYKMQLETSGRLNMRVGNGYYDETTGQWAVGSSREYKKDIKTLDAKTALNVFNELEPVTFKLKATENSRIQVGFIAEDVPDLVAQSDRKGLTTMDIVAVLTKVVQEQQKTIEELKKEIKEIKNK